MADDVWTSVPAATEWAALAEVSDLGRRDVHRGDAEDRNQAKALAWVIFVGRQVGQSTPSSDMTGRSEAFRKAFEQELARLEAEVSGRA